MTAAGRIAGFASAFADDAVPGEVALAAKLHLLDALGCGLAAHALDEGAQARAVAAGLGGAGEATVIGLDERLPAPHAALANGALCHALDFDDTHAGSISHITAVVGPAALAAAEAAGARGSELVAALVAGSEVVARIGAAAAPAYMQQGFHPTSVCGIFGATAAAARLASLDAEATANALGIAGSMASGLFEYLSDGSATKPLHAGWAAQGALMAVRLAARGATGPATVLEGRFGVLPTHFRLAGDALDEQLADLGRRWETAAIAYKRYPCCHFIHGCLDAVAEVAADGLAAEDVLEVVLFVPEPAVPLVLEPVEAKVAPRTEYDAKFSLQYSVAALLVDGEVGVATYTGDRIGDARLHELARRVRYERRDFASYPGAFPGAARIVTADGRTLTAEVPYQRGSVENPLGADEVRHKFRTNALLALTDSDVDALEQTVLELDAADDLTEFATLGRVRSAVAAAR